MAKVKTKTPARRTVFLSYCHADYDQALYCVKWLRPLCRGSAAGVGEPQIWVDHKAIGAGDAWKKAILDAIEAADTFIVLMSIDYANSDFCMNEELRRMLLKHERGHARVIGVALHKLKLEHFAVREGARLLRLDELQCVPQGVVASGGSPPRLGLKPVNQWGRPDDAWYEVQCAVEAALAVSAGTAPVSTPAPGPAPVPALAATPLQPPVVSEALPASPRPANAARLPYLCDRDDQRFLLAERLASWQEARSRRPLVVLTEGRYVDCVQEWVERMHGLEIAQALTDLFAAQGISFGQPRHFVWPAVAADAAAAEKRVRASFATALGLPLMASIGAVHTVQATPGLPALWWTECADETGEVPLRVLRGLLGLLAQWPDLEPRSMLVVAITLVRDGAAPADGRAVLGPDFEALLGEADAAGRVACVALGSLPEVKGPDITAWSQDPRVGAWLRQDPAAVIAQLPAAQTHWPMRSFADMAAGWLRAG